MSAPLTGFTGNSQANFPNQPTTLSGSGLNVSFVWAGGAGAWERIVFNPAGASFGGNAPATQKDAGRNYIRSNQIDFATGSFRAYVTVNRAARESVFFGMGTGALGEWKQPDVKTGNAGVYLELQSGFNNASRRIVGGTAASPINSQVGFDAMASVTGLMRLRMDYNAISKTVSYAINYNPTASFAADQTFATVDVSSIASEWASGENSRIYFGGQGNVTFTNFTVDTSGLPFAGDSGKLTRELWNNIPGATVASFISNPRFGQAPDSVTTFPGASAPQNIGQDFASRIRGYITAPTTGAYTFWIASDDQSELSISSNTSKFNTTKIASVSQAVNPLEWDRTPSQKSGSIQLVAGQKYFIEALHKEGFGLDHLAIAWQSPGGIRELIPASALESFTLDASDLDDDGLLDSWELTHGFTIAPVNSVPTSQSASADPDQDGYTNLEESIYGTNPNVHGGIPGALLLETWNNLNGRSVSTLTQSRKFAATADQSEFIFSSEIPANRANYYGVRLRGYIIAPTSGNYTFYVAGDDTCELWLSPSSSQFSKQKIASVPVWTGIRVWTLSPSQTSAPIALVAGQKYYLEGLMKEVNGNDHLSIAWKTPGTSSISIIPSTNLESYAYDLQDPDGDNMPTSWEVANGLNPTVNDGALDPDLDDINNLSEYTAGTDPQVRATQGLALELWQDMFHYSTRAMVMDAKFYNSPQKNSIMWGGSTGAQSNPDQYFATRARGYLVAPVTGDYRFWVSGRNGVELYLSTNSTKYSKRLIAEINPEVGSGHGIDIDSTNFWDQFSSQQSAVIHLEEGQSYFIETLQVNGHAPGPHLSLAWAPPGGQRELIPVTQLLPYTTELADADDDYLPDTWEIQYGLDILDNGKTDLSRQGERGDFDADGLDNRTEFLLGTNPSNADTDGDGVSDGIEVNSQGTDALVANANTDTFLGAISLANYSSSTNAWTMTSGGLLADSFRGEASWDFSVPSAGNWLLRLDLELMGSTYGNEKVPVVIKVDGKIVARNHVNFGSGKLGLMQALTPWILAGNHQVSVLVDNTLARRTVRLVALKIYTSSNANTILAQGNRVLSHPVLTRTSPAFIEGYARDASTVTVNGSPASLGTSIGHWYANTALLNQSGTQTHNISFEYGYETTGIFTWQATNVMDAESLTIRLGDSLRVGAWGSDSNMPATVTSSAGATSNLVGEQTTTLTFSNAGTFTVSGLLQSGASATLTVKVIAPPSFPLGIIDALDSAVRTLSVSAAAEVIFDAPEDFCRLNVTRSATSTTIGIMPNLPEELGIAARLFTGGPILSVQCVNVIGVSDALQNDLSSVSSGNVPGYKLINAPLTVTNLPTGARVDVSIFRAGVMFTNGTTLKSIYPANLTNGSVILEFLYPLGQPGGYCHTLLVYDRNGLYLGTR